MKIKIDNDVIDVVQFKRELTTGWATRSDTERMLAYYSKGPNPDSNYQKFPLSKYPNAEDLAKAVNYKKDAIKYFEFQGHTILAPKLNKYYWIHNNKVYVATIKDIETYFKIVER